MATSSVGNTYMGTSYEEYQNEQRVRKTELGKNDFLNLLVAQMQYQDPLEPTKDSAFVAQLAQFSALEQMEAMSSSMAMMQAYDLVGKFVYATDVVMEDGSKQDIGGFVDSVIYKNGNYYAQIGETYVAVSKISEVYDKDFVTSANPLLDSAHLIGRIVSAKIIDQIEIEETVEVEDEDGNKTTETKSTTKEEAVTVTGLVTRVGVEEGVMVAYVKTEDGSEKTVPIANIYDIRDAETQKSEEVQTANMSVSLPYNILEGLLGGSAPASADSETTDDEETPPPTVTEVIDGEDDSSQI